MSQQPEQPQIDNEDAEKMLDAQAEQRDQAMQELDVESLEVTDSAFDGARQKLMEYSMMRLHVEAAFKKHGYPVPPNHPANRTYLAHCVGLEFPN